MCSEIVSVDRTIPPASPFATNNRYTTKPATECLSCGGTVFQSYEWVPATTSYIQLHSATWVVPNSTQNRWARTLNWDLASDGLLQGVFAPYRLAKQSEALCAVNPYLSILEMVSCNCTSASKTDFCEELRLGNSAIIIGRQLFCPRVATTAEWKSFTVSSIEISFQIGCVQVEASELPASRYFQSRPLSLTTLSVLSYSETFYQSGSIVLTNEYNFPVGQIVSDGLLLKVEYASTSKLKTARSLQSSNTSFFSFHICIDTRSDISVDEAFSVADIALRTESGQFKILDVETSVQEDNQTGAPSFCFNTTTVGSFFAVRHLADWKKVNSLLSPGQRAAIYIFAILYLICASYCLSLMIITAKAIGIRKMLLAIAQVNAPPIYVIILLFFFSTLRTCYLFLAVTQANDVANHAAEVVLTELPIYIFFSLYLVLIFYWAQIYHRTHNVSSALRQVRVPFLLVNLTMYIFFLLVVILYYSADIDKTALSRAYNTILACVAFLLIGFCTVYGSLLIYRLRRLPGGSPMSWQTGIVVSVVTIGASVQLVFLLLKTWSYVTNFITVILYMLFVEIIPVYFILYEDIRHSWRKPKSLALEKETASNIQYPSSDQYSDDVHLGMDSALPSRDSLSGSVSED